MKTALSAAIVVLLIVLAENRAVLAFDHSLADSVLQRFVTDGLVDYRGLLEERGFLEGYLDLLEQIDEHDFQKWSADEQKALWINAYNLITIEGILRNYPIKYSGLMARIRFPESSIRQIGDFWDTVFIEVMGRQITLDHIEHEILRKQFKDPRIHFVLICAAMGCPWLESRAFPPEDLDARLEEAAGNFIGDHSKVHVDAEESTLYLSSIFKWYREDFARTEQADRLFQKYGKKERGVLAYVTDHLPLSQRQFIIENQPRIEYLDYDWSLNEQR